MQYLARIVHRLRYFWPIKETQDSHSLLTIFGQNKQKQFTGGHFQQSYDHPDTLQYTKGKRGGDLASVVSLDQFIYIYIYLYKVLFTDRHHTR